MAVRCTMAKNKVVFKTRRANNDGSIFQRKDGRWAGYIKIGINDDGYPIRKTIYGKTQTEVAKKLSEISGRIKSNSYELVESKNFEELMFEWLMTFKKTAVTPRTFEGIIRNFQLHIAPSIGKMKVYEIDTYAIQRIINKMVEENYSNDTIKKCKQLTSQFFEYAIDNKWVQINPTNKVKIAKRDRKIYQDEKYKALPPEIRDKFLTALNEDEANFIKPLCITMLFAGLRVGEVIALRWKNFDEKNRTLHIERAITQVPKFDNSGKVIARTTVVGDTKTTCSVRVIPLTDIVVQTLRNWKDKQFLRQQSNKDFADLTAPSCFIFANDDGSVRTYSGTRQIFKRFLRRNGLNNSGIHFHSLRHTFSNMLFELNENPKVIQQLLGHRDVKTTITVYNSVNSEYVREATVKLNEKIQTSQPQIEQKTTPANRFEEMSDEELEIKLELLRRQKRKEKQKSFEM